MWRDVPPSLSGRYFTKIAGGAGTDGAVAASIAIKVLNSTLLHAAIEDSSGSTIRATLAKAGWKDTAMRIEHADWDTNKPLMTFWSLNMEILLTPSYQQ